MTRTAAEAFAGAKVVEVRVNYPDRKVRTVTDGWVAVWSEGSQQRLLDAARAAGASAKLVHLDAEAVTSWIVRSGYRAPVTQTARCAECGRGGAVISAADSSGIVAKVCRSCSHRPAYARSYC